MIKLSVKNKLLLLLIPFAVIMIISTFLFVENQKGKLEDFYRNSIDEKSILLDSLHSMESYDQVTVIYEEYGIWSEMAEFVKNPEQEFIDENLEWLNEGYAFGAVWIYNLNKQEVYTNITDTLCAGLPPGELKEFLDTLRYSTGDNFYTFRNGFLVEYIATTISESYLGYSNGNIAGYMIVAKVYSEEKIRLFESMLNGKMVFAASSPGETDVPPDFTKVYYNWNNNPSAVLLFYNDESLFDALYKSSSMLLLIFMIFVLLLSAVFLLFITRIITRPLGLISGTLLTNDETLLNPIINKRDEFGKISRIIKDFFRNNKLLEKEISERKKAEASIRLLNEELEAKVISRTKEIQKLQDESPLLIVGFNKFGEITEWNKNYSPEINQLIAEEKNIKFLVEGLGVDEEEFEGIIEKIIKTGEQHVIDNIYLNKKAAQLFYATDEMYFRAKIYTVENQKSDIQKLVLTLEDRSETEKAVRINDRMKLIKEKSEQVLDAQESERERIARELHDGIGQMLMAVNLKLESISSADDYDAKGLSEIKNNISEIGEELHNVINDLHPAELSRYGLKKSLISLCDEVEELTGIRIYLNFFDVPEVIPDKIQLAVYRIIQEALRNIKKHSKARLVSIDLLFRNKFLIITVEDNGVGFDVNQALSKGRGTKNLMSRVDFLDGTCEFESAESQGTKLIIRIPVNETN